MLKYYSDTEKKMFIKVQYGDADQMKKDFVQFAKYHAYRYTNKNPEKYANRSWKKFMTNEERKKYYLLLNNVA